MDLLRWRLGLLLAFEMQVRAELDAIHANAASMAADIDDNRLEVAQGELDEAMIGVNFIRQRVELIARLASFAPEDAAAVIVTG